MTDQTQSAAPSFDEQIAALQKQAAQLQARKFVAEQLGGATPAEKDEGMLRVIGQAMQDRLAEAREAGKSGWWTADATNEQLQQRLLAQIQAGQYIDAAVYASMLHVRQHLA